MKIGLPWAAISILLAILGYARVPKALSDEEAYQRMVGTWVNTEYPGTLEFHRSR